MADPEKRTIGEYLRAHRLSQGKTQKEIGGTAVSSSYISQMENGAEPDISVVKLLAICEGLGLPVGMVLQDVYDADVTGAKDSYATVIGKNVLALPEADRDTVIGFTSHLLLKHAGQPGAGPTEPLNP
jgi:transcriptional regulator with XRE-family HTH domain